mmetsp:Transcript_30528/g.85515  ORF Transcript_30528/g.85515 Transcript_30528/m.85515 type:complete len:103 (-) Transcript_30528:156-464(-)|eukprot:CAMPEP_0119124444 /NCGR_PEP_ID=MMETSP1310-20130426/4072_1 /TAXON_ID=464262 /ORGANISM="Genus nov. species nov., Strain RCC2339" /LENGTH=102 /DNA_ID=CAMNT_0007114399 /DNA_START=312 /DNA_END=620 /DNA_ORIENTATION=-
MEMSGKEFRCHYRMSREDYGRLLVILKPDLERRKHSRSTSLTPGQKILIALRFFAGGSYLDIGRAHGVTSNHVHNVVWEVVDAVDAHQNDFTTARGFPTRRL